MFVYKRPRVYARVRRAARGRGLRRLVLTTDNQMIGNRERDLRNGFSIPPDFGPPGSSGWREVAMAGADAAGVAAHLLQQLSCGGRARGLNSLADRLPSLLDPSLSGAMSTAARHVAGPLMLKGILHPDEARQASPTASTGSCVSTTAGGSSTAPASSIEALPAIVGAVAVGRIPVLLDGGVRRGADVLTALALGATCCLIARPQLLGLAVAGEAGVSHVLDLYRRELDRAMGLLGAARLADLSTDLVARAAATQPCEE